MNNVVSFVRAWLPNYEKRITNFIEECLDPFSWSAEFLTNECEIYTKEFCEGHFSEALKVFAKAQRSICRQVAKRTMYSDETDEIYIGDVKKILENIISAPSPKTE